ncbi:MAG: AAA-like domain-containing protein [Calothrix sp. MO_167.B12]|nr:AAA-like domain-containing protein [Calothrix sp. MO_167.B12]
MDFSLDQAIAVANQVLLSKFNRNLTDIEIIVLKGAWHRDDYDQIAAKNQYATSYISQDVAPKLWKSLSDALEEKVKKSNFKEALKRYWSREKNSDALSEQPYGANQSDIKQNQTKNNQQKKIKNSATILYIERPPIESICYQTILEPGSLIRIKAPSLMGKTYLINRILQRVATENYRTSNLSLKLADRSTHLTNLNKFLRWLCINVSKDLELPSELDEYWDEEGMGAKVSCTTYFEEYLLIQANNPLVLCLDDVDILFPYPEIYEDFFGLLRSWYEKARSRKIWQKLRLVIVHSTDVYIRLNINQSPFNVGLPIELSEFTTEQVKEFAQQYQLSVDTTFIESLMDLLGGHPYLLEQAFAYLKNHPQISLEQFLSSAIADTGIYGHHLREQWLNIQQNPELEAAFQQVINSPTPVQLPPMLAYQLHSMGSIKFSGNLAEPRCQLYRQYFQQYLTKSGKT